MIVSKLAQAQEAVQNQLDLNRGVEMAEQYFTWQMQMLQKQSDHDAAAELAAWWLTHPVHAAK